MEEPVIAIALIGIIIALLNLLFGNMNGFAYLARLLRSIRPRKNEIEVAFEVVWRSFDSRAVSGTLVVMSKRPRPFEITAVEFRYEDRPTFVSNPQRQKICRMGDRVNLGLKQALPISSFLPITRILVVDDEGIKHEVSDQAIENLKERVLRMYPKAASMKGFISFRER